MKNPQHTQPTVPFLLLPFSPLSAATTETHNDDIDVAQNDHGWGQDGPVVKCHDQLVSLELPHLIGYRLDFKEGIAFKEDSLTVSSYCDFRAFCSLGLNDIMRWT